MNATIAIRQATTAIITTHAAWDGTPENDRRLRVRSRGADCRASGADLITLTLAVAGGGSQSVTWTELEPLTVAEALRRGADVTKKPQHELAIAAWCAARAAGADVTTDRGLLEEADRRLAKAAELKEDSAPLERRLATWAERLQKEAFDRIRTLVAESKFAEAAQQDRSFRNAFSRRPWAIEHAGELDALQKTALLAGTPADKCDWTDFTSAAATFTTSEGWKASGGILAGNGKEETLRFSAAGIEEISFLFRFPKPDFRLSLSAGDAEIRIEPSRPRFDLLVKREGTTPLQKALKDKGDEVRPRDWHQLRVRFDGANVTVWLDGEDQGSMAMTSLPGDFTLTLAGVSQTQSGAADLDCVLVKRK